MAEKFPAAFSGVEVRAWCIMENHFHLLVQVPEVPRRYWLDPDESPDTASFTQRPPETTAPRWRPADIPFEGDCPRPPVAFALSDEEMIDRLMALYGKDAAERKLKEWMTKRAKGDGDLVDLEKEKYCRRMYNISQYIKTLKEDVSRRIRKETGWTGYLWQGRFFSALVEGKAEALEFVTGYIGFNPRKARLVEDSKDWQWSSYAVACDTSSPRCAICRAGYEALMHQDWESVRNCLEAYYAAGERKLAQGDCPHGERGSFDGDSPREKVGRKCVSEMISSRCRALRSGSFLSFRVGFAAEMRGLMPNGFACGSDWSVREMASWVRDLTRAG